MNRRAVLAFVAVFVVWMAGSFVVHGLLLGDDYAALSNLFRSEEESAPYSWMMLVAHVLMAGAFTWIYTRGVDDRPWLGQGLRFGLAIALLATVPTYMIYYVVQPLPGSLVVRQILYDSILVLVLGAVVARIYRREPA